MKAIARTIILLTLIISTGCAMNSPEKKPPPQQQQENIQQVEIKPELAENVKEVAKSIKGVDESTATVINNEISIALKVGGLDRLRLKSIRQDVHSAIKKTAPAHEIHVTTDKKLYWQLENIEKQIQNQAGSDKIVDIKNKVAKINEDMKG